VAKKVLTSCPLTIINVARSSNDRIEIFILVGFKLITANVSGIWLVGDLKALSYQFTNKID
jgi:hypothetical protein